MSFQGKGVQGDMGVYSENSPFPLQNNPIFYKDLFLFCCKNIFRVLKRKCDIIEYNNLEMEKYTLVKVYLFSHYKILFLNHYL